MYIWCSLGESVLRINIVNTIRTLFWSMTHSVI